jgi:hypothetical protein
MSTIRYETKLFRGCNQRLRSGRAGESACHNTENNRLAVSWRCLAVGKNFSNRRRELLNAGTWHYDAVTAAVSFLGDTQELAALIFPELDVKVLALNLQFSRLDDVIHFCLKGAEFRQWKAEMEEKSARFTGISYWVVAG